MTRQNPIIAIDGPAASGKGTLARRIAGHYGWHHLDTGLTYRAVAKVMLDLKIAFDDEETAASLAAELDFSDLDRETLARHEVGLVASKIATMPKLRKALVENQREFSKKAPGAVLDGRDIGTVVCPDAMLKLFVTASPEIRAERRAIEIGGGSPAVDVNKILADLKERDARDAERVDSPMKPADDAHLLDTTDMTIEAAFITARALIDAALAD